LGDSWNQALPKLVIAQIQFRAEPQPGRRRQDRQRHKFVARCKEIQGLQY
jgi:hypothetical protein